MSLATALHNQQWLWDDCRRSNVPILSLDDRFTDRKIHKIAQPSSFGNNQFSKFNIRTILIDQFVVSISIPRTYTFNIYATLKTIAK